MVTPALPQEAYVPDGFGEQAFHNTTTVHPLGLLVLTLLGTWVLLAKRRNAAFAIVALATLIPSAQRIVVFTLDFNFLRILVLLGLARVAFRREYLVVRFGKADRLVLAWTLASFVIWILLRGTVSSVIYKAGGTLDVLGVYVLARCWIRSPEEFDRIVRFLAVLSLGMAVFFFYENRTGRNLFSALGGVRPYSVVREGRLRCQGPYPHPILAGTYWAVLVPLFLSRLATGRNPLLTVASVVASLAIVLFSASSTPALAALAGIGGLAMWPMRHNMRFIRWSVVAGLVFLHFARSRPVWQLLERVSVVGGSTGDHRYRLVDAAIRNFDEWWLMGTKSTAHWGYYLFDVTNQYILEAKSAGLLGLTLFLLVLASAFGAVGRGTRRLPRGSRVLAWGLGASLFAHCCMFMAVSISYAQQNLTLLLLIVASAISIDEEVVRRRRLRRPTQRPLDVAPRGRQRPKRLWREAVPC